MTSGGTAPSRRLAVAAVLGCTGLLAASTAVEARRGAPAANRVRRALVIEVERRTTDSDMLAGEAERLRRDTADARDRQLRVSDSGAALVEQLRALETAAGAVAVSGPGVEVRLGDSPAAGGPEDPQGDGRIRDRDLLDVANALWAAGAEALALNGRRIGPLTTIREAGEAILVDQRPVGGPYLLAAIGEPDRLEVGFAESGAARRLRAWTDAYGVTFQVRRRSALYLSAVEGRAPRHARRASP